jgi:hypothetical protein
MQLNGSKLIGVSNIRRNDFITHQFTNQTSLVPGPPPLFVIDVTLNEFTGSGGFQQNTPIQHEGWGFTGQEDNFAGFGYFADEVEIPGPGTILVDLFSYAPRLTFGDGTHTSVTLYYSLLYKADASSNTITQTAHGTLNARVLCSSTGVFSVSLNRTENYNPSSNLSGDEFRVVISDNLPFIRFRSFSNGNAAAGTLTKAAFYGIVHQSY